ncbi:MAG: RNA methyltransferase [bacterium]|nr:RNA methyltransferase [bacterium]
MLAVALVHYPTVNKEGKVVTTSVTNFDIHDIARASRTFGVARYFIVTPVPLQQQFTRRIIVHWQEGAGAEYNPSRKDALTDTYVVGDLAEAGEAVARDFGAPPLWVVTSAKNYPNSITCADLRRRIQAGRENFCLVFGTGYGLHPQVIEEADLVLEPIVGPAPFNHLSVRSAVSIYLDRLMGVRAD